MNETSVRLMDRIDRLIRKNAVALGQECRVQAVLLPDGRVRIEWIPGVELSPPEREVEPRVYHSVRAAYSAAVAAHLEAHRVRERAA